jgi:hypothetical protein
VDHEEKLSGTPAAWHEPLAQQYAAHAYVSWHVAARTGKPAPGGLLCERAVLTSAISQTDATDSQL